MGGCFKGALQQEPSIFLIALTSAPQHTLQLKESLRGCFRRASSSPQSREAAAEKVAAFSALSHLYWLQSSSTSYILADLEEISVTKLKDKIREMRGDFIL